MNTLVVAMLFYSIITSLVIMLNGEIYYVIIGLFYLVGGILLSSILLCCSEFLLRSKKIGFDEELPLAQDDLAYTHPCEELHKNGNLTN